MRPDHIDQQIQLVALAAEIAHTESSLDSTIAQTVIISLILVASLLWSGWSTASVVVCTLVVCGFYKWVRMMYVLNFLRKEFTKRISRV